MVQGGPCSGGNTKTQELTYHKFSVIWDTFNNYKFYGFNVADVLEATQEDRRPPTGSQKLTYRKFSVIWDTF